MSRTSCIILFFVAIAAAAASAAPVSVGATVVSYLKWDATPSVTRLRISEGDVAKGFVDVAGPIIHVRTNNRDGYLALFRLNADEFRSARVAGFEHEVEVGAGGGFIIERLPEFSATRTVQYRLYLRPETRSGEIDFPIAYSLHKVVVEGRPATPPTPLPRSRSG